MAEATWSARCIRGESTNDCVEHLAEYVVLAEFDIDTGSTVRSILPKSIPGYRMDWFAEYMLPEGAHNRDSDFTYIFLNRNSPHMEEEFWSSPKDRTYEHNNDADNMNKKNDSAEKADPFLYGINLVKTKFDNSVRRGAIVKAICVFSKYPFVEILKKPLELVMEKYFLNPVAEVLQAFYASLNAVDLSNLPRPDYLEQCLMRRGVCYDPIVEQSISHQPKSWVRLLNYNIEENVTKVLSVPIYRTPDEVGDINVSNLIRIFGEPVMRIYHAVLTKQRVLFVGYNHAAGDLAQIVLSAVAMVAPPMTNVIRRTFPYANLSDLQFLEVPGYIAGVTNPMFQQHESWWDLLCVLDLPNSTGHIYSAEEKKWEDGSGLSFANQKAGAGSSSSSSASSAVASTNAAYEDAPHYSTDNRFVQEVISGISARISEDWVRQQFYDYTSAILGHAQDVGGMYLTYEKLNEKAKKFLDSNADRIAIIEKTSEFLALPTHPFVWGYNTTKLSETALVGKASEDNTKAEGDSKKSEDTKGHTSEEGISLKPTRLFPSGDVDGVMKAAHRDGNVDTVDIVNNYYDGILLKSYIRKLQYESHMRSRSEVAPYFSYLESRLQSESSMQGLLVLLPESTGGLFPIAVGLFHSDPSVRKCAINILQNVRKYQSTMTAFESLNPFLLDAFERQLRKVEDGTLETEIAAAKEREKLLRSWKEKIKRRQQKQDDGSGGGGGDGGGGKDVKVADELFDDEDAGSDGAGVTGGGSSWSSPSGGGGGSMTGAGESTPLSSMLRKTLNMITAPSDYDGKFSPSLDNLDLLP